MLQIHNKTHLKVYFTSFGVLKMFPSLLISYGFEKDRMGLLYTRLPPSFPRCCRLQTQEEYAEYPFFQKWFAEIMVMRVTFEERLAKEGKKSVRKRQSWGSLTCTAPLEAQMRRKPLQCQPAVSGCNRIPCCMGRSKS